MVREIADRILTERKSANEAGLVRAPRHLGWAGFQLKFAWSEPIYLL
jgi:hypothetical protein